MTLVFQVTTEEINENNEIIETISYVTDESNCILNVTNYMKAHADSIRVDLKSVREVLSISQHISKQDAVMS